MSQKAKKKIRIFKGRLGRSVGGDIAIFLVLCVFAAFMALPLIYVINNAFKPLDELFVFPPRFFVRNPTLENFTNLSSLLGESIVPIGRYFLNTVFLTVTITTLHIIFASLAAYTLAKRKFPGQNFLMSLIMMSLMFSGEVTAIPNYIIISKLHLIDTMWSVIIPGIGASLGLFLMKQFMHGVPDALIESAKIDGASEIRIFFKIVMPLVKPAWLTLLILQIQSTWNISGSATIFSEELKTLNYAIGQIVNAGISRAGASASLTFLMLLVPLGTFIITQSNVVQTMASSGIKD